MTKSWDSEIIIVLTNLIIIVLTNLILLKTRIKQDKITILLLISLKKRRGPPGVKTTIKVFYLQS